MVAHPQRERSAGNASLSGQNGLRRNFFATVLFETILRPPLQRNIHAERTSPSFVRQTPGCQRRSFRTSCARSCVGAERSILIWIVASAWPDGTTYLGSTCSRRYSSRSTGGRCARSDRPSGHGQAAGRLNRNKQRLRPLIQPGRPAAGGRWMRKSLER
jgi:hypothetical protein